MPSSGKWSNLACKLTILLHLLYELPALLMLLLQFVFSTDPVKLLEESEWRRQFEVEKGVELFLHDCCLAIGDREARSSGTGLTIHNSSQKWVHGHAAAH